MEGSGTAVRTPKSPCTSPPGPAEIDFLSAAGRTIIADGKSPQSIDRNGCIADILKRSVRSVRRQIEGIDGSVAKVANQQVAGKGSEA